MNSDDISIDECFLSARSYQKLLQYFSGATDCGTGYSNKCIDINTYGPSGFLDDGQIMLSDGTIIMFEKSGWVNVDINGYNTPPNKFGYDVFLFQAIDGEFIPMGAKNTRFSGQCDLEKPANNRYDCANRAIKDSNYFKIAIKKLKAL